MPIKPNNSDNSRSTALSASHTDHTHTHAATTGQTSDQHHAKAHAADHAENAADEIVAEGLGATSTDVSTNLKPDGTGGVEFVDSDHADLANVTSDQHHAQAHTAASHSDQGATGAELETLTDGSATTLHKHDHGGMDGLADDDHTQYPTYGDWQTWTPTLQNITLGNGTIVARYTQIGKLVEGMFNFTMGSTSSMGTAPNFTGPIAPTHTGRAINSGVRLVTSAGTDYIGALTSFTTSKLRVVVVQANLTYAALANITATVPFTWATGDEIEVAFSYEVTAAV